MSTQTYVFGYTGAAQSWVVPSSGIYSITAVGAGGGFGSTAKYPGAPVAAAGNFQLTANTQMQIIVGGAGANGLPFITGVTANPQSSGGGGGGGGSFVIAPNDVPLVVGGGGGGGGAAINLYSGVTASTSSDGTGGGGSGGAGGAGGHGGAGGSGCGGGGGAGLLGSGASGTGTGGVGGSAFSGGAGASSGATSGGAGGFGGGGGGAVGNSSGAGGGGGGGYSGGGGGAGTTQQTTSTSGQGYGGGLGGAGGSYVAGTGADPIITVQPAGSTPGSVTIAWVTATSTSITRDWDWVVGMNQQFISNLCTACPHQLTGPSYSLLLGLPTAVLSGTDDTLLVTVPVDAGSTVTKGAISMPVEGTLNLTIALTSVTLSTVIQEWALAPGGGSAAVGDPGALSGAACTLEAWIETSSGGAQNILCFGSASSPTGPVLALQGEQLSLTWGGAAALSTSTTAITDGHWHHVAVVIAGGVATFYKDGFLSGSATIACAGAGGSLSIGGAAAGNAGFSGEITNVRVWNLARTASQIQASMNVVFDDSQAGLIGAYSFEGGQVVNQVDGTAGTLLGGATIVEAPPLAIPYINYLYVYDPDAVVVTYEPTSPSSNTAAVNLALQNEVQKLTSAAIIGGQGTIEQAEKAAVMPSTTQIVTALSGGATELLLVAMTDHAEPPAGDPTTAFANDADVAIASSSNAVMVVSDYLLLDGLMLPELAAALDVSASAFTCSQDPAVLSLVEDITIKQKVKGKTYSIKVTNLTAQVKNGGIAFSLKGIVSYFVVTVSATLVATVTTTSDGSSAIVCKLENPSVKLVANQDDPAVRAFEALIYVPVLGILIGLVEIAMQIVMVTMASNAQAKLAKKQPTKSLDGSRQLQLDSIVFNGGVICQATLEPTSPDDTMLSTEAAAPDDAPAITSLSPSCGTAGTVVTILGSGFTGASAVRFGGNDASYFRVWSDGKILAVVAPDTETGPVTVVTPGGTLTSSQSFTVTAAPTLTALSPTSGQAGASITLTGTSLAGVTSVVFSAAIPAAFIASDTQIEVTVPAGAVSGPITVYAPSGFAIIDGFVVTTDEAPVIDGFEPTSGVVQTSVTVNGAGFTGATGVTFGGTPASTFTVESDAQLVAIVATRTVSGPIGVYNPAGSATSQATFTLLSAPSISQVSPQSGALGAAVAITGQGFTGATSVVFGTPGIAAGFTVNGDTSVTTTVPSGAVSGPIAVTTPTGTGSSASFTVQSTAPPKVQSFTPTSGGTGIQVQVTGQGFTGTTGVSFGGVPTTAIAVTSDDALTAFVPKGAGSGLIQVTNSCGAGQSPSAFTFIDAPTIQGFSPSHGAAGATVTITGTGFTGATAVSLGVDSTPPFFTVDSPTQISAIVPSGAVSGPVVVTTPGGVARASAQLTVDSSAPPTLSSFAPTTGKIGTPVTVSGSGFTGTTGVSFAGTPATAHAVTSDGTIVAVVPQGAESGPIQVTNSVGVASSASPFIMEVAPSISGFSPSSGGPGTSVTLTGAGFTGATLVTFGVSGMRAAFSVQGDAELVATVPSGSVSGPITVTTDTGTGQSPTGFVVQSSAAPTVTSFTPASGPPGTVVTISGAGFTGTTGVTIGGEAAGQILVLSDAVITAIVGQSDLSGPIGVTNTLGATTSTASFTVESSS